MIAMDELMQAFQASADAQFEFSKAYDAYEGYSWDWAGHHVVEFYFSLPELPRYQ